MSLAKSSGRLAISLAKAATNAKPAAPKATKFSNKALKYFF